MSHPKTTTGLQLRHLHTCGGLEDNDGGRRHGYLETDYGRARRLLRYCPWAQCWREGHSRSAEQHRVKLGVGI